jgi:hypothetical protein
MIGLAVGTLVVLDDLIQATENGLRWLWRRHKYGKYLQTSAKVWS